ncbi:DUF4250 domain-containing protein [Cellulosilyticum sp. I15G10I2]|uniref:DUF4250 domain-containing protein n=1 Tax=Cellulosilyticum sp. I15G10I2 TaxID=1892843 RepID=UPI00085C482E|nr:DUF4250 domain-containing protein [Cellulosilyticum sp. I15G10I2]
MLETKDPYLLLSIVNMKLRDEAESLEDLCLTYNKKSDAIITTLEKIGYSYDEKLNQFIAK